MLITLFYAALPGTIGIIVSIRALGIPAPVTTTFVLALGCAFVIQAGCLQLFVGIQAGCLQLFAGIYPNTRSLKRLLLIFFVIWLVTSAAMLTLMFIFVVTPSPLVTALIFFPFLLFGGGLWLYLIIANSSVLYGSPLRLR